MAIDAWLRVKKQVCYDQDRENCYNQIEQWKDLLDVFPVAVSQYYYWGAIKINFVSEEDCNLAILNTAGNLRLVKIAH